MAMTRLLGEAEVLHIWETECRPMLLLSYAKECREQLQHDWYQWMRGLFEDGLITANNLMRWRCPE